MKIRITGTEEERREALQLLAHLQITEVSKEYKADDLREKTVYVTIRGVNQGGPLEDWRIIEYCNTIRSKADVMRNFSITFEQAEEILDRLTDSGALLRWVYDKKYIYLDARWLKFVKPQCKHCEHRGGFGICSQTDEYAKVGDSCDKFAADWSAFYDICTAENYTKLLEAEHDQI